MCDTDWGSGEVSVINKILGNLIKYLIINYLSAFRGLTTYEKVGLAASSKVSRA